MCLCLFSTAQNNHTNHGKYLFGNSAIPLDKGQGYYQNNFLIANSVAVGLSDHIAVGAGLELISFIEPDILFDSPIYQVHIGYATSIEKYLHLSAGLYMINSGFEPISLQLRTKVTLGNNIKHMTLELKYGTFETELMGFPEFNFSAASPIAGITSLVFESYLPIPFYDVKFTNSNLTNLAGRFTIKRHHQLDVGISLITEDKESEVLPYIGYTYQFGK